MSNSTFLEEFSGNPTRERRADSAAPPAESGADAKASFDEGYNCGWQDGVASVGTDEGKQREALAEALQELKFTYFEARQHVLKSVRPVLKAMVDVALPSAISASLGAQIIDLLEDIPKGQQSELLLSCSPENEEMLREVAETVVGLPITIKPEPTLTSNQVVLHFEDGFRQVDLDGILASIRRAIEDFYATPTKELADHG